MVIKSSGMPGQQGRDRLLSIRRSPARIQSGRFGGFVEKPPDAVSRWRDEEKPRIFLRSPA
jgi:hypothetical protein